MGRPRLRHRQVLLLVDVINDMVFPGSAALVAQAVPMARRLAKLKARAKSRGVPCVYCNDNFGRWRSDFRSLLNHCLRNDVRGRPIAELLAPNEDDYFVLKPKHSGFHSTTLDVLLAHLGVTTLVLTGIAGNFCVLFTAHDAYMRDYRLLAPEDCIASADEEDNRYALEHMASVCKADLRPSTDIDFHALNGAADSSYLRRHSTAGRAF